MIKRWITILISAAILMSITGGAWRAMAQGEQPSADMGTAFTYQGYLAEDGEPASGVYDFEMKLYDDPAIGNLLGTQAVDDVQVNEGLFKVTLDFGVVFSGEALWLEIGVRPGDEDGAYTPLTPRQGLTPAPYAVYASRAQNALQLDGEPAEFYQNVTNVISGTLGVNYYSAHSDLDAEGYLGDAAGDLAQNNGALQATLNADLLDGQQGSYYQNASNIDAGTLATDYYSAHSDLSAEGYLGDASGDLAQNNGTLQTTLNADLLDGQQGSYYQNASNINAGTLGAAYYSAHSDLNAEGYLGNASGDLAQNNGTRQTNLNADLLDGQQGSAYQARVSGTCAAGSTIQSINADGSVDCYSSATNLSPPFSLNVVDEVLYDYLSRNAIIIGSDGFGLISYYDEANGALKVAHCEDIACSNVTISVLDTAGISGGFPSVTIGPDGFGLISYFVMMGGPLYKHLLKVAHCQNIACTSAEINVVDNSGSAGQYSSITIGSDGYALISYKDHNSNDALRGLKVAHCTDADCSSADIALLDNGGGSLDVGYQTSIAIGRDGLGLISYRELSYSKLKTAHCSNLQCSTATITELDSNADGSTSVAIGSDGLGLISYVDSSNSSLKVAHCSNINCTSAAFATLDNTAANVGNHSSITIGADGFGLISYRDATNGTLKVAHCNDVLCSSANLVVVDSGGDVGYSTSLTIGVDGFGLISYLDDTNGDLKVAHCSDRYCIPYVRRR